MLCACALTGQQVELYRRILETGESAGTFQLTGDRRTIATNIVALEDAYGLYIVEGGPPRRTSRLPT